LTLARTLVAGNTADRGREVSNRGTIFADNSNLFGVNGHAGVAGFSPGATDVVPPAGVQLADILNPTLADHGGSTQTHALVRGSPAVNAIPATDPGCTGADQRGVPRPHGVGCDIGAVEYGPAVTCGGQRATIVGTAEDDVLLGTSGDDVIHGMGGNDHIDGLGGHDLLCGGDGDDVLRGRTGADLLRGGRGSDTLIGGSGPDSCDGGAGADTVGEDCEVPQEE
jgi:Ca2+-binding RTX toxin-like protein